MTRPYTRITPQLVTNIKKYLADERDFSRAEISKLTGVSETTVSRVAQGSYDQLFEESQEADSSMSHQGESKNITEIPFDRMEFLIKCEMFVEELLNVAILSDKDVDELYFPRRYTHSMCERYFPERTQKRIQELTNDTNA